MTNVRWTLILLLLSFSVVPPTAHAQRSLSQLNDQIYQLKQMVRLQKLKEESYRSEVIYPLQNIIDQIKQSLEYVNKNDTRTILDLNESMSSVKAQLNQCYQKLALMIQSRERSERQLLDLEVNGTE